MSNDKVLESQTVRLWHRHQLLDASQMPLPHSHEVAFLLTLELEK